MRDEISYVEEGIFISTVVPTLRYFTSGGTSHGRSGSPHSSSTFVVRLGRILAERLLVRLALELRAVVHVGLELEEGERPPTVQYFSGTACNSVCNQRAPQLPNRRLFLANAAIFSPSPALPPSPGRRA